MPQDHLALREHKTTMALSRFFWNSISSTYSHPLNWPLFPNAGNCRIKHGGLSCSFLLSSVTDLSLQRHWLVTYCHKQTTPKPRSLEQYPLLFLTICSWLAASADLGQAWLGICLVTERDTERGRIGATFAINLPHSHEPGVLLAVKTLP